MADLVWLADAQGAVIEPFMPKDQPGPARKDDRQIISGILHVLTSGCRWRDCPAADGPRTAVYIRFNRWSRRGFWTAMLAALAKAGWSGEAAAIGSTSVRAHRPAHGGKGGAQAQAIGPLILSLSKDARWPDDQAPRAHRRPRPARRPPADAGQRRRRLHRPGRAGPGTRPDPQPGRRQGLRRRLAAR